jgi:lipopolysaccharide heptosyltransferase I
MNVALVKLSSIGDVVHALPVAAALHAALPQARLTWIVERREAAVLRGHPALHEIVPVDTRNWRRARTPLAVAETTGALVALGRHLRAARFDVAIDLQGLVKSGAITAATGAPLRIGFTAAHCREGLNVLFTNQRVAPPPAARHVVDRYLALVEPLGARARAVEFALPTDTAAATRVDELLMGAGLKPRDRLVVLNPGAGRPDKRWPIERFGTLARRLADEAGASVLVIWGPNELADARAIVGTETPGRAILAPPGAVLAPPTNLDELLAVLRRASVLVAADTGPLHLAAALGTRCVGLYGPTAAERNGPYGSGHRALQSPDRTMASLGVDPVCRAVVELLDGPAPDPAGVGSIR